MNNGAADSLAAHSRVSLQLHQEMDSDSKILGAATLN